MVFHRAARLAPNKRATHEVLVHASVAEGSFWRLRTVPSSSAGERAPSPRCGAVVGMNLLRPQQRSIDRAELRTSAEEHRFVELAS